MPSEGTAELGPSPELSLSFSSGLAFLGSELLRNHLNTQDVPGSPQHHGAFRGFKPPWKQHGNRERQSVMVGAAAKSIGQGQRSPVKVPSAPRAAAGAHKSPALRCQRDHPLPTHPRKLEAEANEDTQNQASPIKTNTKNKNIHPDKREIKENKQTNKTKQNQTKESKEI